MVGTTIIIQIYFYNKEIQFIMNTDFIIKDGILVKYNGTDSDIIIPDSVTNISDFAFLSCKSLTSIIIPDGVTSIDSCAFYDCTNLESINIPNSVTEIGVNVFESTALLENQIKETVRYVDTWVVNCDISATEVIIKDGTKGIAGDTFSGCISLTSVTIPNSVTNIGESAFENCTSLTSVIIPNSVTNIGKAAFENCDSLQNIVIPNSVTNIGSFAFYKCKSLQSIIIPDSITSIEWNGFRYCISLQSITIPNSITNIGESAFEGCTSLHLINLINNDQQFKVYISNKFDNKKWQIIKQISSINDLQNYYSSKNISDIIEYIFNNDDIETLEASLLNEKHFTKENINKYIELANKLHAYQCQITLTNYKREQGWYNNKNNDTRFFLS